MKMYESRTFYFLLLIVMVSAQEPDRQPTSNPDKIPLEALQQIFQFLGVGDDGANSPPSIFSLLPLLSLLTPESYGNLAALLADITKSLNQSQLGQFNDNTKILRPPITTLPFDEFNATEFISFWENLSNHLRPEPIDPIDPTSNKIPENKGGNNATIFADFNLFTLPQLFQMLNGHRR